jgi:hypothetical protein
MKKFIIAIATVSALAAGASAAQAKVNIDLHIGGFGGYHPAYEAPYYPDYYEPVGYYKKKCHIVKVKHVKWVYGEKVVFWKNKKICKKAYVGY